MQQNKIKFDSEERLITVDEWIAIPDNPIQRNTAKHAAKALTEYLHVLQPPHLKVVAGRLDKKLIKVDGHTRSYLWERDLLERPSHIAMTIYDVESMEDITALYKMFDNPTASETPGDKLTGALRWHNLPINSPIWTSGGVTTALKAITKVGGGWKNLDMRDVIEPWKDALKFIDRINVSHMKFPAPVFAAMVISVKRDKSAALTFWEAYKDDIKTFNKNGTYDALYALYDQIRTWKEEQLFVRGSQKAVRECVPVMLGIYQAWARGENELKKTPKPEFNTVHEYIEAWIPSVHRKLLSMKEEVAEIMNEKSDERTELKKALKEKGIEFPEKKRRRQAA